MRKASRGNLHAQRGWREYRAQELRRGSFQSPASPEPSVGDGQREGYSESQSENAILSNWFFDSRGARFSHRIRADFDPCSRDHLRFNNPG